MNKIRGPYKFPYILGATKLLQFFQIATSADNGTTIYRLGIVTGQHHLVIPFYNVVLEFHYFLRICSFLPLRCPAGTHNMVTWA